MGWLRTRHKNKRTVYYGPMRDPGLSKLRRKLRRSPFVILPCDVPSSMDALVWMLNPNENGWAFVFASELGLYCHYGSGGSVMAAPYMVYALRGGATGYAFGPTPTSRRTHIDNMRLWVGDEAADYVMNYCNRRYGDATWR